MSEPLLWEPQNQVNQFVFKSLTRKQGKADLELLKKSVQDYINICSQSDNGTRGHRKSYNFNTDIDATVLTILIETASLVLSGELDEWIEKREEIEN